MRKGNVCIRQAADKLEQTDLLLNSYAPMAGRPFTLLTLYLFSFCFLSFSLIF